MAPKVVLRRLRESRYRVLLRREGQPDELVEIALRSALDSGPTVYALVCLAADLVRSDGSHWHPEEWALDGDGNGAGGVATDDVMNGQTVASGQRLTVKFHRCLRDVAAEATKSGEVPTHGRGNN